MHSVIILSFTCVLSLHPQPPLPKEDYPQDEDQDAEEAEELLATGHPALPKEYVLSHASRTAIPRATLDRSTSAGWTLNVDPNGAWVFTSEHSPDQVAAQLSGRKKMWLNMKNPYLEPLTTFNNLESRDFCSFLPQENDLMSMLRFHWVKLLIMSHFI